MIARIVPTGIDFCASLRSPDLFEPAMIPTQTLSLSKIYLVTKRAKKNIKSLQMCLFPVFSPVTEGKKMPTRTVKEVAISEST